MSLQIECPRCEKRLPSSATFCRRCGVRVAQRFGGITFRPPPAARTPSGASGSAGRIVLVGMGISLLVIALFAIPSMNESPQPARVYPGGGGGGGGGGGMIPSGSFNYPAAPTPTPAPTWPYSQTGTPGYSPVPQPGRPYYTPGAGYGSRPPYGRPYGAPYGNTPYGNPYGPQGPSGPGGPPSPGGRGR